MTQQRQAQAVISREIARIGRPPQLPDSSGIRGHCRQSVCARAAPVLRDRHHHPRWLQIARRQPRRFARLTHSSDSLLSLPEPKG
jgi:hypothetical protein